VVLYHLYIKNGIVPTIRTNVSRFHLEFLTVLVLVPLPLLFAEAADAADSARVPLPIVFADATVAATPTVHYTTISRFTSNFCTE